MGAQGERVRLLDALLGEFAEKGYERTAVDGALQRAGLDRNGYLVEFVDKDVGLAAAYDQLTERLIQCATAACVAGGVEWPRQVRAGLTAVLGELAANPELARVLVRSYPAIGPEARRQYQTFVEGLAPLLSEGREFSGIGESLPAEVEMLAIGAAEAVVFDEIEAGRTAALPAMCPEILFSLLVPFIGPDAASAEMEAAREEMKGDLEIA